MRRIRLLFVLSTVAVAALLVFGAARCRMFASPQEIELGKLLRVHWEDAPPEADQLAAIEASHTELRGIGEPNVYAAVATADLRRHLPAVEKAVPQVKKVELRTTDQQIAAAGEVTMPFGTKSSVRASMLVLLAPAVLDGELVLRPTFRTVKIRSVDYREKEAPSAILAIVNAGLDQLLDRFGSSLAISMPLELRAIQSFDPGAAQQAGLTMRGGKVDVNLAIGRASILVDDDGIHVLGEAVNLTPKRLAQAVTEIEGNAPLSTLHIAALSECSYAATTQDARFAGLRRVCEARAGQPAVAAGAPAKKSPIARTATGTPSVEQEMERFTKAFRAKAAAVDGPEWDATAIAISKPFLAASLNELTDGNDVRIRYELPTQEQKFDQELKTEAAPNLNCGEMRGCESHFTYRNHNERGCDSGCAWWDAVCHARKAACEATKAAERGAYEAEKAAAQAAWTARKVDCERLKATERGLCELEQTRLRALAHMPIGQVRGTARISGAQFDAHVQQVRVSPAFDAITVNAQFAAGGRVDADINYMPLNAGHIACFAKWSGSVSADVIIPPTNFELNARVRQSAAEGDDLVMTFATNEQTVPYKISPPPFVALMSRNPHVAIACPVTVAGFQVGMLSPKFRETLLRDSFEYKVAERDFTVRIPARQVPIGSAQVKLVPRWTEKSIAMLVR